MAFGIRKLKPEIDTPIYWLHLAILSAIALGILQIWQGGNMFTIQNILYSIPVLAISDVIAHTVLGLE